jgi:hypothetical protein
MRYLLAPCVQWAPGPVPSDALPFYFKNFVAVAVGAKQGALPSFLF